MIITFDQASNVVDDMFFNGIPERFEDTIWSVVTYGLGTGISEDQLQERLSSLVYDLIGEGFRGDGTEGLEALIDVLGWNNLKCFDEDDILNLASHDLALFLKVHKYLEAI